MFYKSKADFDNLLAAQSATLSAQNETMKSQASFIANLDDRFSELVKSNLKLTKEVEDRDWHITVLMGYLNDFGVNVETIKANQFWWNSAKKMIKLSVDEGLVANDLTFSGNEQRKYASLIARSVIGH